MIYYIFVSFKGIQGSQNVQFVKTMYEWRMKMTATATKVDLRCEPETTYIPGDEFTLLLLY